MKQSQVVASTLVFPSRLTYKQIRGWANEHRRRTGAFPSVLDGPIVGTNDQSWARINTALREGLRGLPGGNSLSQLLGRRAGTIRRTYKSRITIAQIEQWARVHRRTTGRWPSAGNGLVDGAGEHLGWYAVHAALYFGFRGLPGGSSLSKVLRRMRER